jgi:hypothetical protein
MGEQGARNGSYKEHLMALSIREMIAKVADDTQAIDDMLSAWLYEHDDGVTDQDAVDIADSIHEHLSSAVELAVTLE